uniref:Uncharacterized protein n=1 Tax=Oryza nivara TaxID=4536 RepID=A0A0E0GH77_ORYNI
MASAKLVMALVAAAVLMQCCGVLLAARPLEGDVAGGGGWRPMQTAGGGGGKMPLLGCSGLCNMVPKIWFIPVAVPLQPLNTPFMHPIEFNGRLLTNPNGDGVSGTKSLVR